MPPPIITRIGETHRTSASWIGGTTPFETMPESSSSMNRNLPTSRPTDAITAPTTPVTTASMRNGSCVYQRVAPTRRITPTSVRRVNADTCTVLEISMSAAMACTRASANVTLRTPPRKSKSFATTSRWSITVRTPTWPFIACLTAAAPAAWSPSFTRSVAGSDCGRTTSASDWPANSCL